TWVAPSSGTIQITGNAKDLFTGGGGGVFVTIRKGSAVLWQQAIANGNTTGFNFNVTTTITAGQTITFWINRGADGNNGWDATGFDPTITLTDGTAPPPPGGSAIVSWNANTEADLSGYRVYYGTSSRNYLNSISVGKVTSATITGLTVGTTYYIAVKAVDTSGNLSGYSAEVTKRP
ncbi:MAG: fibronectin type III domain-containing protein, partial [Nitrospirota bacterium]